MERITGKQILPSIFEGYIKQMDEKLKEIKCDAISKDSLSIYRTAHAIKSMSTNIGADKVRAISFQIEKSSKAQELDGLSEIIELLVNAYDEFVKRFSEEVIL
ncbi:MAG: Hpt domain-containing protein [Halioglobus sp.]